MQTLYASISYIERLVNEAFSFCTILRVPNIDLYYYYVELKKSFDNLRTRCQNNIIKDMSALNNTLEDV